MNSTIPRDFFKPVMAEFRKLDSQYPTKPAEVKLDLAKKYVRALALADSLQIMRMVYGSL